jgi:hypothetical protein
MPILLADVVRAIWRLRRDRGFAALAVLAAIAMLGGAVFYWRVEDLRPVNAAYLSVTTLTTVGGGDVSPQTGAGKIFTSAFVLMGVGILLALFTAIATQLRRQSLLHRPLARLSGNGHVAQPASPGPVRLAGPVPHLAGIGEYDLLVIGSDEASLRLALDAAQAGLRVVVAEPGLERAPGQLRAAGQEH